MRDPYVVLTGQDGRLTREHVLVAEKALVKPLPPGAEVHHVNGDKRDNRNANLVICQDHKYHKLLHARMARLRDLGRLDVKRCSGCGAVKALAEFHKDSGNWDGRTYLCKPCACANTGSYRTAAR